MLDHFKTLYFIGLGLVGAKDITVKGLEIVKQYICVNQEMYTSTLTVALVWLILYTTCYGRKLILADGDMADELLKDDMVLREVNTGIQCRVIHNASMNAVECCGLQNFGETVSIVFWTDTWRPETFYDEIKKNRDLGMNTLCLIGECYNFFEVINTNRFTKWKIYMLCLSATTPNIQQDLNVQLLMHTPHLN
uniref:Diphthamide biosynthesis 5 n=1 Tax=Oncorhynchus kisutch TaxID=8019 RepID=A0A8C7HRT3_ONCKI